MPCKRAHVIPTRANFGLGAQLACCARDKAAEAVRSMRVAPERRDRNTDAVLEKTCPTFRDHGSVRYAVNSYKLKSLDRVSLNTLSGRVNVWYLGITQTKAAPAPALGIVTLATDTSDSWLSRTSQSKTFVLQRAWLPNAVEQ